MKKTVEVGVSSHYLLCCNLSVGVNVECAIHQERDVREE